MKDKKSNVFKIIPLLVISLYMFGSALTTKNVEIDVLKSAIEENQVQEITLNRAHTSFKVDNKKMKTEPIQDDLLLKELLNSNAVIDKKYEAQGPPFILVLIGFAVLAFIFIMLRKMNNLKIYRNFGLVQDDFFMEKSEATPKLSEQTLKSIAPAMLREEITANKILVLSEKDNVDLAKYLSAQLDQSYLNINITDVYNMFRMLGAYRVEKLFNFADKNKPNIIYFDTILKPDYKDVIKKRRLHADNSVEVEFPDTEQRLILIQFLEELKKLDDDITVLLNIDRKNEVLNDLIDENDFNLTLKI